MREDGLTPPLGGSMNIGGSLGLRPSLRFGGLGLAGSGAADAPAAPASFTSAELSLLVDSLSNGATHVEPLSAAPSGASQTAKAKSGPGGAADNR